MSGSIRKMGKWFVAGATGLSLVAGSGALAQQPATTEVAPVNVGAVAPSQIGQGARMYTTLELRMMDADAGSIRDRFEEDRSEIYGCYQKAFGVGPNTERTDAYVEGSEAARRLSLAAADASKATDAMEAIRADMATGKATQTQLDVAELARQAAVRKMEQANRDVEEAKRKVIDVQELAQAATPISGWSGVISSKAAERAGRKNPLVPRAIEDMSLTDIHTVLRGDGAAAYLYVTGKINNNGRSRSDIPALALTAQDGAGQTLKAESVQAPGKIEPGAAMSFAFAFKPGLTGAARVSVTFEAVNRQPNMMPVSADPVCAGGAAAPQALNPRNNNTTRLATPSGRANQLESPETVNTGNGNTAATAQPTIRPQGGAP